MSVVSERVDAIMETGIQDIFQSIEDYRRKAGQAPSQIMRILEDHWGLGDPWADWWSEGIDGDEEWS